MTSFKIFLVLLTLIFLHGCTATPTQIRPINTTIPNITKYESGISVVMDDDQKILVKKIAAFPIVIGPAVYESFLNATNKHFTTVQKEKVTDTPYIHLEILKMDMKNQADQSKWRLKVDWIISSEITVLVSVYNKQGNRIFSRSIKGNNYTEFQGPDLATGNDWLRPGINRSLSASLREITEKYHNLLSSDPKLISLFSSIPHSKSNFTPNTTSTSKTSRSHKKDWGRWMYQAEQTANNFSSSCGNIELINSKGVTDIYTANCNGKQIVIKCNYGECVVLK